jgi:hypothetical protein
MHDQFSNISITVFYILIVLFSISTSLAIFRKSLDADTVNSIDIIFIYQETLFVIISWLFLFYKSTEKGSHFQFLIFTLSLINFAIVLWRYKKMIGKNIYPAMYAIFMIFILMIPGFFALTHS